jgi:hypothetical protein
MRNLLLALLIVLLLPTTATAAVDRPATAEIRQDGTAITWVLGIPSDELVDLAGGETKAQLAGYMANNVRLALDTVSCPGEMTHATPERFGGLPFTRVHLRFECPEDAGHFTVTNEMLTISRTDYELGGTSGSFRFDADHTVLEAESPKFPRWLRDGFEAFALGWQHVLFLALLLLGARTGRELGTFAAVAAAASVVGLTLGALEVVTVSERVLETLTVASVVGVAALPVLGIKGTPQLALVAALALVHGLALAPARDVLSGYALGVLLAEAVVVTLAAALPLAWRALGRTPGARGRGRARSAAR